MCDDAASVELLAGDYVAGLALTTEARAHLEAAGMRNPDLEVNRARTLYGTDRLAEAEEALDRADELTAEGDIVPRFTALQVYQAVLESQASEHAARMIAMRNATDNAKELVGALQLAYNKVRQQTITNDILDIVGGAEALAATK